MTMMNNARVAGIAILLLLAGCARRVPVATVEVIDTSMSITPRAERSAQSAVGSQISQMRRGDRLILISITGDAQNDAGGRVLRLSAPSEREPYDNDLRRFRSEAQKQFAAWSASLDPRQMRTDILGSLDVARQEFAAIPKGSERRLIIVSDFLEDESSYHFVSAPQLADNARAKSLASILRSGREFALPGGVPICLGRLESSDFASLSPHRKDAVRSFWMAYLTEKDRQPELYFDGTGMLTGTDGCFTGPQQATTN
jgi:hypothetical protein